MNTDNPRESEVERRRETEAMAVEIVEGSAKALAPRKLDQMVSLRLDPSVLAELKEIAESLGRSVSDCLRDAVSQWIVSLARIHRITAGD